MNKIRFEATATVLLPVQVEVVCSAYSEDGEITDVEVVSVGRLLSAPLHEARERLHEDEYEMDSLWEEARRCLDNQEVTHG